MGRRDERDTVKCGDYRWDIGGTRGERMGEGEEEGGVVWERKGKRDYLCIQEHCTVVSSANKETKKLANVGNRCHSCEWKKKTNVPGKRKKKQNRRESAVFGHLITRQNTDLTSWPQPSHMMGFGNEPIELSDADEFSQSCWCGNSNTYRIKRTIQL